MDILELREWMDHHPPKSRRVDTVRLMLLPARSVGAGGT